MNKKLDDNQIKRILSSQKIWRFSITPECPIRTLELKRDYITYTCKTNDSAPHDVSQFTFNITDIKSISKSKTNNKNNPKVIFIMFKDDSSIIFEFKDLKTKVTNESNETEDITITAADLITWITREWAKFSVTNTKK